MKKLSKFASLLAAKDPVTLEVVQTVGVSRSTCSRWARGQLCPSVARAKALRQAYAARGRDMPLEAFFASG